MLSSKEALEKDSKYIIRAWSSDSEPTVIVEGEGALVRSPEGKEYIDCSSGLFVMVAGHRPNRVVKAITEQANKVIQISMRQTSLPVIAIAEKLAEITPGELGKSYFTTGGSEAVEAALKMAKQFTGKTEIVALQNAYHGLTLGALTLTASPSYRKTAGGPLMQGVLRTPNAYCYRCAYEMSYPECELRCAQELDLIIQGKSMFESGVNDIAAVIVEPVQGAGGIIPPEEWLVKIREICSKHDVLLIVDEIQTAFGRTGKMFACDHAGVVPDIMSLAKGVGGGVPMGLAITRDDIAENFKSGTTATSAGNVIACAAGLATIETIIEDNLCENSAKMGLYLQEGLYSISPEQYVGNVMFKGLMGGIELVKNKSSKEPFTKKQMKIMKAALYDRGIIVSNTGPYGNIFRIQPPLVLSQEQADHIIKSFAESLNEVVK